MTRRLQTAHFGDIARPHVHSDQFSPWYLRVRRVADDLRHSDAATEKRGLGCSIRRRRNGKPFGAQTTNVLTKFTAWLAGFFFILTFALSILYSHKSNASSNLRRELMKSQPTAATTASPTPKSRTIVSR